MWSISSIQILNHWTKTYQSYNWLQEMKSMSTIAWSMFSSTWPGGKAHMSGSPFPLTKLHTSAFYCVGQIAGLTNEPAHWPVTCNCATALSLGWWHSAVQIYTSCEQWLQLGHRCWCLSAHKCNMHIAAMPEHTWPTAGHPLLFDTGRASPRPNKDHHQGQAPQTVLLYCTVTSQ